MAEENMNGENSGGATAFIITAIIAFAIGFGSAWLIYHKKGAATTTKVKTATTTDMTVSDADVDNNGDVMVSGGSMTGAAVTAVKPTKSATLKVSDQSAGTSVEVTSVTLGSPSWVVVRESNEDGTPGRILGAQLFDVGTNSGTVELLRGTLSGKIYFASVNDDNGDNAFDPKLDLQAKDSGGNSVMTTFKAN